MVANNITLSACLIVKNEEKQLPGCLESIKNMVDEIIIVDTGSTDQTIEIAKVFGAKVYGHQWENDFSKHRNQAVKYASGNWLLNIDADERLVPAKGINKANLIAILRGLPAGCNAISLPMRDINPQGEAVTEYMNVRLVKNTADFHYEGIVHENPIFKGPPTTTNEISLNHHGYHLAQQEMDKKLKRNTKLLLKRAEKNPNDIATYFYLANHYAFVLPNTPNTLQKAIEYGRKCIQLLAPHRSSSWPSAYLGIFRTLGEIYFLVGDNKEAEKWCMQGLKVISDDPDLHFLMCKISIATSKYEQTVKYGDFYLNSLIKYRKTPQLARGRLLSSVSRDSEIATHYRIMAAYLGMRKRTKAEERWLIVKDYVCSTYQLRIEYLRNLSVAEDSNHLLERTVLFYLNSSPRDNSLLNPLINFAVKTGAFEHTYKVLLDRLPESESSADLICYIADCLIKKGCCEQAATLLKPLYSSDEINADIITLLALACEKIGDNKQARRIYDFHLNDSDVGSDFIINAMNYYKNISDQKALQTAVSVLMLRHKHSDLNDDVLLFLVEFYWISARYDDFLATTMELFARHIRQLPLKFQDHIQIAEGYASLSTCLIEKEKHNLAFQALHIAWSITGNPKYLFLLGNFFTDTDQTIMALQYYQEALNREYITPEILDRMHDAHLKVGNHSGATICQKMKAKLKSAPELSISKATSYEEYVHYANQHQQSYIANLSFEKELVPVTSRQFTYGGYCYVCKTFVDLTVDFNYAYQVDGVLMPNWRERLVCPICQLNNRMRAVVHIFDLEFHPTRNSNIYITEQTTGLYKLFKQSFPDTYGSEYLGNSVSYGQYNGDGIRNEDLTQMSFAGGQFDFILSFDVFEHIPNYKKALAECYRCIKPGGILLFSVPFVRTSKKNVVRAYLAQKGEIVHLLPPEYHGDPINPNGCLCFYHFGWEILEDLKAAGFKSPQALLYWSKEFGYLGGEQFMFAARKD